MVVIAFDFGGVVGNQDVINLDILRKLLSKYGLTESYFWSKFEEPYSQALIGKKKFIECFEKVSEENSLEMYLFVMDAYEKLIAFDTDVLEVISSLRKKGYRVICLSNVIKEYYEIIRQKKGYEEFDELYFSCKIHIAKPNQAIYHYVLTNEQLAPQDVIFIDDNKENINSANAIGMKGILFKDAYQIKKEIKKYL